MPDIGILVELNSVLFILSVQCGSDAKKVHNNKCFLKGRLNQPEIDS